jgi:hypothetical protein
MSRTGYTITFGVIGGPFYLSSYLSMPFVDSAPYDPQNPVDPSKNNLALANLDLELIVQDLAYEIEKL